MLEILNQLDYAEGKDIRQQSKVKHKMKDVIAIALFATIANANEWEEIEVFGRANEEFLGEYLELPYGIPSHDTIQRVIAIVNPQFLQNMHILWNEMMSTNEGEKLKKLLNIDGKTICGSGGGSKKPTHVVTAYSNGDGISLAQRPVKAKENEIVAIPELLRALNIKGHIVTIDAMGTQIEIAKQIRKQGGDYVLAVKGNQPNLHKDIIDYFDDTEFRERCKHSGGYHKTIEKARGGIEKREYYQTDDIDWMYQKGNWAGLRTIGMTVNTIEKDGNETVEKRYYISNLGVDAKEFGRCVRGHWGIESMHWHLDVTFKEDANKTIDEQSALNLNIIRKFALSVLKTVDIGKKRASLKLKRFTILANSEKFLRNIIEI
jgi:predicted transposase YbfD/YdcC